MSNHGRWRVHSQADDIAWTREVETCKVRGYDGYMYEPCWIHPSEAEKRGIKNGDIVMVHNERGIVLCGAYVTERIMPGVAYVDHGARHDPICGQGGPRRRHQYHLGRWNHLQTLRGSSHHGYLVEVPSCPAT
jgi:anaerobic selenocysteine-containing dehydrogenase